MDGRILGWKLLILVSLASLTVTSSSPFPYLQIYPPNNDSDSRTPLYFALMLSSGGDYTSIGALPAVQIALDYINSNPSILPEYRLHYTLTDSQCNRSVAIDSFFREMIYYPKKVGWVGSGCSVATDSTAELTRFYNITQVSCASVSPALFYEDEYRHYFQLLASSNTLAQGFYGIIRDFNWRKVSLITQNEIVFVKMMAELKRLLLSAGIEYTERVFASTDSIAGLTEPFDSESRIFIWAMYSPHARALACEAYRRGLYYPRNQFLIFGWYGEGWLVEPGTTRQLSCTLEERTRTLNYALTVGLLDFNTNASRVTEGGLTLAEFEEEYREKISNPVNDELGLDGQLSSSNSLFPYSQQCHEATLTLAYALHQTSEELANNQSLNMKAARQAGLTDGETFTLANFTYSNSAILERMSYHIYNTDFLGITGNRVTFNENGTRPSNKNTIHQYLPGDSAESHEIVEIGVVEEGTNNFSRLNDVSERQIWPEGIPSDGIHGMEIVSVAIPLTVAYSTVSAFGLCFAVCCLVFNFVYRKKKLMILSSTSLNYLIGAGSLISYFNIITSVSPSTDQLESSVLCNIIPFAANIAISLSNGTIGMKMIRLWYISNRPKLNKKLAIKDVYLFVAVMILVTLDIIIIGLYLLSTGLTGHLGAILTSSRENPIDIVGPTERVIENLFYMCPVTGPAIVFSVLYGFKALLLVLALVLALRTRKSNRDTLDDYKYIAATVYITNVVLVVIIVSNFALVTYVNVNPAVQSGAKFIGTTTILCLTFVPKMVALYRDPDGENIKSTAMLTGSSNRYTVTTQDEHKLESLRQRIRELEVSIKQCGNEEDDQEDEEEPQRVVIGSSVGQLQFSDDTSADLQSSSLSQASTTLVTE